MFTLKWDRGILRCHYTAAPELHSMGSVTFYVNGRIMSHLFSIQGSKVTNDFRVYPMKLELL